MEPLIKKCYICSCPIAWDLKNEKCYIIDQHYLHTDHCKKCGENAQKIYFDFLERLVNE